MTISVALATRNGAPYLRQQLQSFLDQTRPPDELVICDDASGDDTVKEARSALSEAPFRVMLETNTERLGVAANFNKALGHCHGDIVALSDQDDVWFPHKLKLIEAEFRRRPDQAVLINDAEITDANLRRTGRTRIEQTQGGLYSLDHHVQGSCTSLRRSLLQYLLPVPSHLWTHDTWIHAVARLLDVRGVIYEPLQYFRRHDQNESNSPTSSLIPLTTWRALAGKIRRNVLHPPRRQVTIEQQIVQYQYLSSWFQQNSEELSGLPYVEADLAKANASLVQQRSSIAQKRVRATQRSRVRRPPHLAALYLQAGVEPFGGKTELFKDLIIR